MPRKKGISDIEWMDKHIQLRKTIVDDLLKASNVFYSVKKWTPLKLISIGYFTKMYTNIISKNFDRWIYCDFFAGCGLNRVEKIDYFPGSPFIALEAAKFNPFHRFYLVEKNPSRAKALSVRLHWLSKNIEEYKILSQDHTARCYYCVYNESYDYILSESDFLEELSQFKTHSLTVIDPEGFEIGWNDLSSLFPYPIDIIYIFMTSLIGREWGKARKGKPKSSISNMNRLFGDDSWNNTDSAYELPEIFQDNIEAQGRRVVKIKIQDSKINFFYHLFLITRPTKGNNPWLKGVETLKTRIERAKSGMVQASFDYIHKRKRRVTDFF